MMEKHGSETPHDLALIAERFIESVQKSGPPKTPPLVHVAIGAVLSLLPMLMGLAYWSGTLSNRVAQLEQLTPRVVEVERRTEGVQVLASEIQNMRRDIDRMFAERKTVAR